MPTVLQINVSANVGSTGRIAEQINQLAMSQGWDAYLAYGRSSQPCKSKLIPMGNKAQVYEHYAEHRLFDNDGLASRLATKKLVQNIDAIKPDIINLHNIHDHYLNYRVLFEYLNTLDIPIIWTQHDVWSFTGGCMFFDRINCTNWRNGGCKDNCPIKQNEVLRNLFEKTRYHYELKKQLFTGTKHLTLVSVSNWLEGLIKESFLKDCSIRTIHNGIDINAFTPCDCEQARKKYRIGDSRYLVGVASIWDERKGFDDFVKLNKRIPSGWKIVLVGLNGKKLDIAKQNGIIGVPRTENVGELAALYSGAELFLNLTYEDNYPTTNLEAMACGTPVLTYKTGGSVEAVDEHTGWIVKQGDLEAVASIILKHIESRTQSKTEEQKKACRKRAEQNFDKSMCFKAYLDLYNSLINQ